MCAGLSKSISNIFRLFRVQVQPLESFFSLNQTCINIWLLLKPTFPQHVKFIWVKVMGGGRHSVQKWIHNVGSENLHGFISFRTSGHQDTTYKEYKNTADCSQLLPCNLDVKPSSIQKGCLQNRVAFGGVVQMKILVMTWLTKWLHNQTLSQHRSHSLTSASYLTGHFSGLQFVTTTKSWNLQTGIFPFLGFIGLYIWGKVTPWIFFSPVKLF